MELMVVIAITTLMLVLLMPFLTGARRGARLTVCATNLSQIGTGVHTYAADMNGEIPYGPEADPRSIVDFYIVDGMVTSQLSLLGGGTPVGIGLLLESYLDRRYKIVFCTDSDQSFNTAKELERFGRTQSVSGYFYRHGSNTLLSLSGPSGTWDDHIRLSDLGLNRHGEPIQTLLMDQNFVVDPELPVFNIITRTNHRQRMVNALYADGHVETLANQDGQYTVMIGTGLHGAPDRMLEILERADMP